jgi:hypothetical protein
MELIFHNGLFCHFSMNEVIPVENYNRIESQLLQIQEELSKQPYQYLLTSAVKNCKGKNINVLKNILGTTF